LPDIGVIGNTIKIDLIFRNWVGYYADPSEIRFSLFNCNKNIYEQYEDEYITLEDHRTGVGRYSFYVTLPDSKSKLIVEVTAQLNENQLIGRLPIEPSWISDIDWDQLCPGEIVAVAGNTIRLWAKYRGWGRQKQIKSYVHRNLSYDIEVEVCDIEEYEYE